MSDRKSWISDCENYHRRDFLKVGSAGLLGITLADLRRAEATSREAVRDGGTGAAGPLPKPVSTSPKAKSVIMVWLAGGPATIDMWDPKPDAPAEVRGPFSTIQTTIPGVRFSEHLPLQASIAHKLSILRSVDCKASNHTPITMQAGNNLARRVDSNRDGDGWPSMGSIAAKFHGSNDPSLPPFVALADSLKADVWGAGHMGGAFEPIQGSTLAGRLNLPEGLNIESLRDRDGLRQGFDKLQRTFDANGTLEKMDQSNAQAMDLVLRQS